MLHIANMEASNLQGIPPHHTTTDKRLANTEDDVGTELVHFSRQLNYASEYMPCCNVRAEEMHLKSNEN